MHHGILPAVKVRSGGSERAGRSCAFVGKGAAEIIGIGIDGNIERSDGHKAFSVFPFPLLGQSFLGEGLTVLIR